MRIMKASEAVEMQGIKVLVYGEAGVGKTRLCTTTGELDKTLILSAESGLLSIRDVDVDVAVIEKVADLQEAYRYLRRGDHGYRWVCLDSISEIGEQVLERELEKSRDGRKAYGEMATTLLKLLKSFRDLPVNVVITAKVATSVDDGRIRREPSLPGRKMQSEIPYLFDEVFALRAERKEDGSIGRGLLTQPTGAWVAKDRSGALDTWEPASIESIAGKISIATDGTGSTEAVEPTKGSTTEEGGTDAPSATDGALARHRSRYFALLGEVPLSEQGKKIVAESYREKTGVESRSEWSAEQYRQRADELAQRSADKRGDGLSERLEMLSKMTGAAPYKLVGGAE